jgi:hypothetical protein
MHTFETDEARRLIETMVGDFDREGGLGDVVLRIVTRAGKTYDGQLIAHDDESSPDGVLLSSAPEAESPPLIRYEEMIWIGMGYGE